MSSDECDYDFNVKQTVGKKRGAKPKNIEDLELKKQKVTLDQKFELDLTLDKDNTQLLIDWGNFSFSSLEENNIRHLRNYIDWDIISRRNDLSLTFISEFADKLNWEILWKNYIFATSFIEKHIKYAKWDLICEYQVLDESFLTNFSQYLDWNKVAEFQILSDNFIRRYIHKFDIKKILKYQRLKTMTLRVLKDYLNWNYVSRYQILDQQFIDNFQNKLSWCYILKYQKIDREYIVNNHQNLLLHLLAEMCHVLDKMQNGFQDIRQFAVCNLKLSDNLKLLFWLFTILRWKREKKFRLEALFCAVNIGFSTTLISGGIAYVLLLVALITFVLHKEFEELLSELCEIRRSDRNVKMKLQKLMFHYQELWVIVDQ
ncbi:uncharacterized protein LOC111618676 [Centruroides sculpturatus]|uniref:uncharacterized protein LOC111618676 n=1 Tax=Centruroides sculpturatus TaxID=218467 RepID=UPI000C6E3C7D|nr:uncharacterized protein LOC111618676 [Centruroides sculpturatus]